MNRALCEPGTQRCVWCDAFLSAFPLVAFLLFPSFSLRLSLLIWMDMTDGPPSPPPIPLLLKKAGSEGPKEREKRERRNEAWIRKHFCSSFSIPGTKLLCTGPHGARSMFQLETREKGGIDRSSFGEQAFKGVSSLKRQR